MGIPVNKFTQAKVRIGLKHPFFATLMMLTPHEMDRSIPTAQTNMVMVRYNPDFLAGLPLDMVVFVIVHELSHIFLKHGFRRGHRDPHLWNIACDHAINLMLREAGFTLWPKCYADAQYRGMSAEAIYERIAQEEQAKQNQPQPQPGAGSPQTGAGQPSPGSPGQGQPQPGQGQPAPGSASPAQGPYGHLPSDPLGDDVQDAPGGKDGQAEAEKMVNEHVARAAAIGRMAGKMPGCIDRLLKDYFDPPLWWEDILADFMMRLAHDDESWSRRNRRYSDIYLPGRRSTRMGEVVIIGDTSGSMGDDVFGMIAVQLNYICETCKPERVRVVWADDADCSLEEIFEENDEILLHPKGGGGTDMRKPLRFVEQYDPEVVILITDGYTPWPATPPHFPLIVLCTSEANIPMGEVVRVSVS